jgi:predicted PurR-regulated permease PerM
MTTFQIIIILLFVVFLFILGVIAYKGGFTIRYEKTVTNINKMDELQLEVAKANLEALKEYNENAAKNAQDTSQALQTITSAAQAFMGVNSNEDDRA